MAALDNASRTLRVKSAAIEGYTDEVTGDEGGRIDGAYLFAAATDRGIPGGRASPRALVGLGFREVWARGDARPPARLQTLAQAVERVTGAFAFGDGGELFLAFLSEGLSGVRQPPAFFDAKSESKAAVTLATLPASVNYSLAAGEERWVWAGEMRGAES